MVKKKLKNLEPTLSLTEIFKIMIKAKKSGIKVFGLTGAGEPLLDNRAKKIIKKANTLGFITHMPTNTSILNKKTPAVVQPGAFFCMDLYLSFNSILFP